MEINHDSDTMYGALGITSERLHEIGNPIQDKIQSTKWTAEELKEYMSEGDEIERFLKHLYAISFLQSNLMLALMDSRIGSVIEPAFDLGRRSQAAEYLMRKVSEMSQTDDFLVALAGAYNEANEYDTEHRDESD